MLSGIHCHEKHPGTIDRTASEGVEWVIIIAASPLTSKRLKEVTKTVNQPRYTVAQETQLAIVAAIIYSAAYYTLGKEGTGVLRKIILIKNVGRFLNYSAIGYVELKRHTLIFAENGRGKTTLSAALRSLQSADAAHTIQPSSQKMSTPMMSSTSIIDAACTA